MVTGATGTNPHIGADPDTSAGRENRPEAEGETTTGDCESGNKVEMADSRKVPGSESEFGVRPRPGGEI